MIKRFIILVLLLVLGVAITTGCGSPGDPLDSIYTSDILPGERDTYNIGSQEVSYQDGFFNGVSTGKLILKNTEMKIRDDGTIMLVEMANSKALHSSLYFSTDNLSVVYKDSGGVLHGMWK